MSWHDPTQGWSEKLGESGWGQGGFLVRAKPAAECSYRPAGRECPFLEHASTFFVPVQHHTGTSQYGSSLAIPLRASGEWHRLRDRDREYLGGDDATGHCVICNSNRWSM